jgi:plastocyanin
MADDRFTPILLPSNQQKMRTHISLSLIISLTAAFHVASAADIVGTVTLKGTPPAEKEITPLEDDATCGKLHSSKVTTHFYEVGANGALADVVVMLKGISGKSTGASAPPIELDQKGCLYVPQILAIQTNQKLVVKNSDPVLHNVHTTPTVAGNQEENQAQMPNSPPLTFTFSKPENFLRFKCDVHPWMFAWVTVVDHPYFAVTGSDGTFKISNVPPGKYTISALHRKAAPTGVDKEIEVKDGAPTKVDFVLDAK